MAIMQNMTNDNKDVDKRTRRIAKNSLLLFMRIFCITIINLFSVRYILKGLGKTDYGVYNAVAGFVLASGFIVPVLAISVQRFLSFAKGENDNQKMNNVFSASVDVTLFLSMLVIIIMEVLGIWFVNTQMSIPTDRMWAANWIFQLSLFSFILSLAQIPFTASIFANEDMGVYALVSTIDCAMKFFVAYMISFADIDKLVFYVAGLCAESILLFAVYAFIGMHRYQECRYNKVRDKGLYKELLSFSGWTLYGAIAGTGMLQGSNILLNVFFGPIANAAYGVAYTVYNAFNALNNSVVLAFRPAMIQSYAAGNFKYLNRLFYMSNKVLLYLLVVVSLPIMLEVDDILLWWLNDVDGTTVLFCRLFIIYGICLAMHNPITTIIQSTGHVRNYSLSVESITILNIPLGYLLFRLGTPAECIFASMIGLCSIAHCVRLICLKRSYSDFSIWEYVSRILLPAIFIIAISYILSTQLHSSISSRIIRFIAMMIVSPCMTLTLVLIFGLRSDERTSLFKFLQDFVDRKFHKCV